MIKKERYSMSQYITELSAEATDIINNARHAAEDGEITHEEAQKIISDLLRDVRINFFDNSPVSEAEEQARYTAERDGLA